MKGSTPAQMDLPSSMDAMCLPPRDTSALHKRTTQVVRARGHRVAWLLLCLGLNGQQSVAHH